MKKLLTTSLLTVALTLGLYGVRAAQSKTTDFSGAWTLDKSRTSDLPPTLESYTLTVTQDAQQLTVETDLQGEIVVRGGPGGPGGGRGGGGGRSGGGFPGGIGFPGGGGMGGGIPKDRVMAMALQTAPPKVAYTLDGKGTVLRMEECEGGSGQPGGTLTVKARWKNGGRILELQSTRQLKTPDGNERSMTSKDRWELSEDGMTLTVKRAIDMPMGAKEAKLVFTKQ